MVDKFSEFSDNNFLRPLTNNDLGIIGNIEDIQGTFSINNQVAIVKINLIQGEIKNPFEEIIHNLRCKAIEFGANNLKIEAIIVNEKLYNVLTRRYGLKTLGGVDTIALLL